MPTGTLRVLPAERCSPGPRTPDRLRPEPSTFDPWSVMFTSGTTGLAKGAVMTHQYWYTACPRSSAGATRDVRDGRRLLRLLADVPCRGLAGPDLPVADLGLPVAIDARFSTSGFWDRVRRFGATQLLTMGASHLWLWNQAPAADDADNPARVWAPIPLPYELRAPFQERFGIEHLWSTYGGTEFMSVTLTDVRRPWCRGRLRAGAAERRARRARRFRPRGWRGRDRGAVRPPVGARTRSSAAIYGMPETTLERFRDLWYHTGDLVRIDETGELFFVDRKDDYLRVRGENVASYEVEAAIERHEAVVEVAAYGIRDGDAALVAGGRGDGRRRARGTARSVDPAGACSRSPPSSCPISPCRATGVRRAIFRGPPPAGSRSTCCARGARPRTRSIASRRV